MHHNPRLKSRGIRSVYSSYSYLPLKVRLLFFLSSHAEHSRCCLVHGVPTYSRRHGLRRRRARQISGKRYVTFWMMRQISRRSLNPCVCCSCVLLRCISSLCLDCSASRSGYVSFTAYGLRLDPTQLTQPAAPRTDSTITAGKG